MSGAFSSNGTRDGACMYSIVAIRLTRDKRRQRRWKERTKEKREVVGGGKSARLLSPASAALRVAGYPRGHRFTGEPASRKNRPERINISSNEQALGQTPSDLFFVLGQVPDPGQCLDWLNSRAYGNEISTVFLICSNVQR